MDNGTDKHYFVYGNLTLLYLFFLSIFWAGKVTSGEISVPIFSEQEMQHWFSQYQPPDTLAINKEIECLAQNIYFEARSESRQGQLAVGHVVMNRVGDKRYPNSVCGVVKQGGERRLHRCQFSWWCDGQSDQPLNKKAWQRSLELASIIYRGDTKDPTGGALWYHAEYVNPKWSSALVLGKKIGLHLFYLRKEHTVFAMNSVSLQSDTNPIKNAEQLKDFPHFKVSPSYSGMDASIDLPVLQL